jgi:hypothetical protein
MYCPIYHPGFGLYILYPEKTTNLSHEERDYHVLAMHVHVLINIKWIPINIDFTSNLAQKRVF